MNIYSVTLIFSVAEGGNNTALDKSSQYITPKGVAIYGKWNLGYSLMMVYKVSTQVIREIRRRTISRFILNPSTVQLIEYPTIGL